MADAKVIALKAQLEIMKRREKKKKESSEANGNTAKKVNTLQAEIQRNSNNQYNNIKNEDIKHNSHTTMNHFYHQNCRDSSNNDDQSLNANCISIYYCNRNDSEDKKMLLNANKFEYKHTQKLNNDKFIYDNNIIKYDQKVGCNIN